MEAGMVARDGQVHIGGAVGDTYACEREVGGSVGDAWVGEREEQVEEFAGDGYARDDTGPDAWTNACSTPSG
jgi:hypothetical protein